MNKLKMKEIESIGLKIDKLTVVGKMNKNRYIFQCECGKTLTGDSRDLKRKQRNIIELGIAACKDCTLKHVHANRTEENIYSDVYKDYRLNAKERGYIFNLNRKDFTVLIKSPCYYCGEKDTNSRIDRNTKKRISYNGVDRVDNEIGYEIDNVVPCCKKCNYAKGTQSMNDFINRTILIADRFRGQSASS